MAGTLSFSVLRKARESCSDSSPLTDPTSDRLQKTDDIGNKGTSPSDSPVDPEDAEGKGPTKRFKWSPTLSSNIIGTPRTSDDGAVPTLSLPNTPVPTASPVTSTPLTTAAHSTSMTTADLSTPMMTTADLSTPMTTADLSTPMMPTAAPSTPMTNTVPLSPRTTIPSSPGTDMSRTVTTGIPTSVSATPTTTPFH